MDFDRTTTIAGLKIKAVRDAVREMARHDGGWTIESIANHIDISPTHAEWLSEMLVDQNILERKLHRPRGGQPTVEVRYVLGEYGTRFTLARMLKRIDRAKVDKIIADLLKRVAQINSDPQLCYFVNEIRVFGSEIDSTATSFGDIDIAYDLGRRKRPPKYKDWHDWAHERWKLAGRSNLDFMQQLFFAKDEVRRLLKARNQYLSLHDFDDLVGIGARCNRLFVLPEGQIDSEDESGEKLHQTTMANAKKRVETREQRASKEAAEPSELTSNPEQRRELAKQRMITAVQSLAFDLLRTIDEASPSEALDRSIAVAHQRIGAYREINALDRIPDVLRNALSVDIIDQSAPEKFVFSELRERNAHDGTDKKELARRQVTHAVLKNLRKRILGGLTLRESYDDVERCFSLRREADFDEYNYRIAHPLRWQAYQLDWLSKISLTTLRNIANRDNATLHKQALRTLSKDGLIKPFRKGWRITRDGERALNIMPKRKRSMRGGKTR